MCEKKGLRILRRTFQTLSRVTRMRPLDKEAWVAAAIPNIYPTLKAKCIDVVGKGVSCVRVGHSCPRKISGWVCQPARGYLRKVGRAIPPLVEQSLWIWEVPSLQCAAVNLHKAAGHLEPSECARSRCWRCAGPKGIYSVVTMGAAQFYEEIGSHQVLSDLPKILVSSILDIFLVASESWFHITGMQGSCVVVFVLSLLNFAWTNGGPNGSVRISFFLHGIGFIWTWSSL